MTHRLLSLAWLGLVLGLGTPPALAQVRLLTLGIDVNCPPGLGECWGVGIREGVARFAHIESAALDAEGATQTAEVRTRGGRLISLGSLARHIESIQMGARLRGIEATVDGWLELSGSQAVLKIGETGQSVRLAPLSTKTQFDRRLSRVHPASEAERKAYQTLLESWNGKRHAVRVIGPLRAAAPDETMILEVREAYWFGEASPRFPALTAGIRVNSPYGLGEPWPEARASLLRFAGIQHVAEAPDIGMSTANFEPRDGRVPDLDVLNDHLKAAGIGASVTGFEVAVEGRLIRKHGQLLLSLAGGERTLPLAPLTRKIQWDYRQQREARASRVERDAYARLASRTARGAHAVRVAGPVTACGGGDWTLLEVREFEFTPRSRDARTDGKPRDTTPPAPVAEPGAIALPGGKVLLDWDSSEETDVAGYNVYRSATPHGRFVKLNREPVAASEFDVAGSHGALTKYYAITVVDRAGNESARSIVVDARPPEAPRGLVAEGDAGSIRLRWDPVEAADLESYSVHRSETPGGPYAVITVGVSKNSHIDSGAQRGRTYFYKVTAVDGSSNESAYSNECMATTAPAQGDPSAAPEVQAQAAVGPTSH